MTKIKRRKRQSARSGFAHLVRSISSPELAACACGDKRGRSCPGSGTDRRMSPQQQMAESSGSVRSQMPLAQRQQPRIRIGPTTAGRSQKAARQALRATQRHGDVLIQSELPCGACLRRKPVVSPRYKESTAGFDGASHCVREQDKTVLWFRGNELFGGYLENK